MSRFVSGARRVRAGGFSLLLATAIVLMVAGLAATDRILRQAAAARATDDAETVALALETSLAGTLAGMAEFSAVLAQGSLSDASEEFTAVARSFVAANPRTRRISIVDADGRLRHDTVSGSALRPGPPVEWPAPLARHSAVRFSGHADPPAVGLYRPIVRRDRMVGAVSVVIDAAQFTGALAGPETREHLLVSGDETELGIASTGDRGARLPLPRPRADGIADVRLPGGGTWRVAVVHEEETGGIRAALWIAASLTAILLTSAVLRERRQTDRTAQRSAELERLYSEVARANTAKSEFLANVSHELRTPLNAIVGFVELLKDGVYGDLSPRQVPPVDRIAASATHLRHLVDQVLDIAKIAAGRLEVHAEPVVLRPFVLNIASELESLFNERNLSLSIAVGASLPRVRTDPNHLRQILINLIGNAAKYTTQGSVAVRARLLDPAAAPARGATVDSGLVRRAPDSRRPWIAVQVADTGIGIAPDDQARIFDEFEQVDAGPRGESMRRGTGLGLAISRRLARLLGGDIGVESELGRGSTFTLWLPVERAEIEGASSIAVDNRDRGSPSALGSGV